MEATYITVKYDITEDSLFGPELLNSVEAALKAYDINNLLNSVEAALKAQFPGVDISVIPAEFSQTDTDGHPDIYWQVDEIINRTWQDWQDWLETI